jgi:hypothetical protein
MCSAPVLIAVLMAVARLMKWREFGIGFYILINDSFAYVNKGKFDNSIQLLSLLMI